VPAMVVALRSSAAIGWRWWTLAGLCFGIATAIVWDRPFTLGGALLAAPLMAVIMAMASSRKVMGKLVIPPYLKTMGWIATAVRFCACIGVMWTWK